MERVFLVSCVAKKKPVPAPAADLYLSDWFCKARAFVAAQGGLWFILSAKHGLLAPDEMIAPYDLTLNKMSAQERRAWAEKVKRQMDAHLPDADKVVILAGEKYRAHLMPYLEARFAYIEIPMKGLKIGEQLSWLNHAAKIRPG